MRSRPDDAGPNEAIVSPSEAVEAVLTALEDAGYPEKLNDQVAWLVERWESTLEVCRVNAFPDLVTALEMVQRDAGDGGPSSDYVGGHTMEVVRAALQKVRRT